MRFVEALQQGTDSWLVFLDEGLSLHQLMYAPDEGGRAAAGMPGAQQGPSNRWDAGLMCDLRLLIVWLAIPDRQGKTESAQAACSADSHAQVPGGLRLHV